MATFLAAVAVWVLWVLAVVIASMLFGAIVALILRRHERRDAELEDWMAQLAHDEGDGDASR